MEYDFNKYKHRLKDIFCNTTGRDKSKKGYNCPCCSSGRGKNGTGVTIDDKKHTWKCWSCGSGGDIYDLIGYHESIIGKAEQFKRVYEILGGDAKPMFNLKNDMYLLEEQNGNNTEITTNEEDTDYTDFFLQANRNLSSNSYMKKRGISDVVLERFKVGFVEKWKHPKIINASVSPRIIIPTSRFSYFARDTREDECIPRGQEKYSKLKVGGVKIFNLKVLEYCEKPVFIVESEIDALSIIEVGGEAVALGSANNVDKFVKEITARKLKPKLILALDNDKVGNNATRKLENALKTHLIDFTKLVYPEGVKDANEALNRDRDIFKRNINQSEQFFEKNEFSEKIIFASDYSKSIEASNNKSFCIDGLLYEGQIALLAGDGGCGKSFLCLRLLHDLSRGVNTFSLDKEGGHHKHPPKKVLFVTAEDDYAEIGGRLKLIEKQNKMSVEKDGMILSLTGIKDPYILRYNSDIRVNETTSFFEKIMKFIVDEEVELLILDPLANIGGLQDENNNTEAYNLINALQELIEARGRRLSIILTHHFNKTGRDNEGTILQIRGASAFVAGVRLACSMHYDNDKGNSYIVVVKSNSLTRDQKSNIQNRRFVISSDGVYFEENIKFTGSC